MLSLHIVFFTLLAAFWFDEYLLHRHLERESLSGMISGFRLLRHYVTKRKFILNCLFIHCTMRRAVVLYLILKPLDRMLARLIPDRGQFAFSCPTTYRFCHSTSAPAEKHGLR
jgi:hypothetical protein